MVITISGTQVQIIGEPDIIFQNNNLVNTLAAVTDKDESWQYNVDIFMPNSNRYNSIIMTRNGNMLSVDLTRQMLPENGRYVFQFRGQSGNAVYHTDKFCLWVKDSIDLNEAYDPMPAEFYQMESQMKEILKRVQETAAETLPEINESTNGKYLTNDGIEAKWADVETGLTQEAADARYLQLSGGTMSGNIDMGGSQIRGVRSIAADGATGNAGVQFASNGNFTNIVCGVSTSASFSANAVDFYNHNLDRVNSINMTSEATVEDAKYIGGNVEKTNRTAIDFTTENAVGIWAQGTKQVNIDANGVNVNGNNITGASNIIANGSTTDGLRFESNGATARVLCGGTTSASFSESAIDAYEHRVVRVGAPINNTDAARKQDVDAVQTAVDTVGDTVNDIIDGTEAIPYLPEDGGTLSGPLNMGNNKITMGGTPTETTDVTNKGYVDGVVGVVSTEVDKILDGTSPVAIPAATTTHLGGVIVGEGLSVEADGTLSVAQAQSATPIASATELGCVKVGTGLVIEEDGSLEATAGLYRDAASGIVFVGPNTSKTMRLSESFQVLYGTEYGISGDALDPEWGGPFYMNAGQSKTIGNLQVAFDSNGAEFTITNSHASVCYFFLYGGYSLTDT